MDLRTTDELTVWPEPMPENPHRTSTREKDEVYRQSVGSETSAYRRLQLAMDYWCALWFWPLDEVDHLPSRIEFLMDMLQILNSTAQLQRQGNLDFGEQIPQQVQGELGFNEKPISAIIRESARFTIVDRVRNQQHFFHWELSCAHIFNERGGFDLIVGNPPWIKVSFDETALFSETNPIVVVREKEYLADRVELMAQDYASHNKRWLNAYVKESELTDATKTYLNSIQLYPLLQKLPANLYMCFITRSWEISHKKGIIGFVHPYDFYTASKAGPLRKAAYERLRYQFQFQNELYLFAEVAHRRTFSVSIYSSIRSYVCFDLVCNLFTPNSLIDCYDGQLHIDPPEGIRNEKGNWSTKGHPARVLRITDEELHAMGALLDPEDTPVRESSLASLHISGQLKVLNKIANFPKKISVLGKSSCFSYEYWNETGARKDGTIKRMTGFSPDIILSSPHVHVGNPLYKTPRSVCVDKADYDNIDLQFVSDDYQPRMNYSPSCSREEYLRRSPTLPWNPAVNYLDVYKLVFRKRLSQSGERTLDCALTCAGTAHVNAVRSLTTAHSVDMLAIASMCQSLIGDYYIKLQGASNLDYQWQQLPLLPSEPAMILRVLVLNCLTVYYDSFWREVWQDEYRNGRWYGEDARLPSDFWTNLTPEWHRHCALRNDFARRWALCELDVLVARAIGLNLQELCDAYRMQFPVLFSYESETAFDKNGRIVYTNNFQGLKGVGVGGEIWKKIKDKPPGFTHTKTYTDNTLPTGPVERTIVYEAPFDRRDREVDYATIWAALDAEEAEPS